MKPSKNVRRREGDLLAIDLEDGRRSYAHVAAEPLIVFFEGCFTDNLTSEEIGGLPILCRLWVANHAITKGRWSIVGRAALAPENQEEPFFYKQDAITGRLSLYHSSFAQTNWERAASLAECEALECAAVWEPEHVEDRLRNHYDGKPNKWTESLEINVAAIS
ncbi:immunity 26/phosphotriesterase HocA family protein [Sphingobium sp. Z007]|uniref:immunity 26/phosphotriesterase HocA family protein n=1 Tax=Sphingobium sp. Z007 TaxID=627495 RepID=UPI000B499498|nr:immunity 26/phosphotriesterase HocA family protein [Sphingobium sp. Z007]